MFTPERLPPWANEEHRQQSTEGLFVQDGTSQYVYLAHSGDCVVTQLRQLCAREVYSATETIPKIACFNVLH